MKKSVAPKDNKPTQSPEQKIVVPEIKVEPVFEVTTPAPDMVPIAAAIEKLMSMPKQDMNITVQEPPEKASKPKKVKIEVERDGRGFIQSLICTEITDG